MADEHLSTLPRVTRHCNQAKLSSLEEYHNEVGES